MILPMTIGLGTHLFVKVPRPGDSEVPFQSSSQAGTYYYQSNHSKVEAIPLSPRTQQKYNLPDCNRHTSL